MLHPNEIKLIANNSLILEYGQIAETLSPAHVDALNVQIARQQNLTT